MAKELKTRKISKDEAMNARKEHLKDTPRGQALMKAEVTERAARGVGRAAPSWDPETRSARFTMSSQSVDRYGDIVVTDGIQIDQFVKNPVAHLFHKTSSFPVGFWDKLEKSLSGRPKRLEGDIIVAEGGGPIPEIDQLAWALEKGLIRACSIGFIVNWEDAEAILDAEDRWTGGIKFNSSELLECSVCAIPANQDALIKMAEGDQKLALELVEEILDNFERDPTTKLILPRKEVEKTYGLLTNDRKIIVIEGKKFAIGAEMPDAPVDDATARKTLEQIVEVAITTLKKGDVVSAAADGKVTIERGDDVIPVADKLPEDLFKKLLAKANELAAAPAEKKTVTDAEAEALCAEVEKIVPAFDGGTCGLEFKLLDGKGHNVKFAVSDGKWKYVGELKDDEKVSNLVIATEKADHTIEFKAAEKNTRQVEVQKKDTAVPPVKVEGFKFEIDAGEVESAFSKFMSDIRKKITGALVAKAEKPFEPVIPTLPKTPSQDKELPAPEAIASAQARAKALLTKVQSL